MRIYADSCVFLAWLKKENEPLMPLDAVSEFISEVESPYSSHEIVLSEIIICEVLPRDHYRNSYADFKDTIRRFRHWPVDRQVAEKAAEICKTCRLTPLDGIHVATAILSEARYFCTSDQGILNAKDAIKALSGNITEVGALPISGAQPTFGMT